VLLKHISMIQGIRRSGVGGQDEKCRYSEDDEESGLLSCMYTTAVKGPSPVAMHLQLGSHICNEVSVAVSNVPELIMCIVLYLVAVVSSFWVDKLIPFSKAMVGRVRRGCYSQNGGEAF